MNPQFVLAVAVGGAIGSVARYLVAIGSGQIFGINFPWGILIINVTGSFLIGVFVGLFATKWDLPQSVRIFLLYDLLDVLFGQLLPDGAWSASIGIGLHGWISCAVDRRPYWRTLPCSSLALQQRSSDGKCPVWVIFRLRTASHPSPLIPQQPTCGNCIAMSISRQKRS